MEILINKTKVELKLSNIQNYKNMSVIPLKYNSKLKEDILYLEKGLEMGIVKISEINDGIINYVYIENNAETPLILVEGEEIIGAKQNRIISKTMLIPPLLYGNIAVNCVEMNRWAYKKDSYKNQPENKKLFKKSNYFADYNTRGAQSNARYYCKSEQEAIWNSIHNLEEKNSFKSETASLNDNYKNSHSKQNKYLKHFPIKKGQSGCIIIANNEIKNLELFFNPGIYKQYHEKILRSHIINLLNEKTREYDLSDKDINIFLNEISDSKFIEEDSIGLGNYIKFFNKKGNGSGLIYKNSIIHLNYFNNIKNSVKY